MLRRTPLTVALVTLAGCGSSGAKPNTPAAPRLLDTGKVQLAIQQSVQDQRHVHVRVLCPQTVQQEKGTVFSCTAVNKKLGPTPFTVTVQNDAGYVTYAAG